MDENQAALIAEQLRHANSLLQGQLEALHVELQHYREFSDHRLKLLESEVLDHEQRIRAATDGVTQFKMWSGLANAGSSFFSIAALIKTYLTGS